jgi:probable phosphomutase (TIGR03848 family)
VTLLLLIRHGVTDATGVRLGGWTPGIHLTEEGRVQAEVVAERLRRVRVAAVYASPLERCVETAAPLARDQGRDVVVRDGLGEVRYGAWTDRPLKQLARTRLWRRVQSVPSGVRFPGGESLLEVQSRALLELETISADHRSATVAVVSHADVIKLVVAHFAGAPIDLFQRLIIDPASICAVAVGDGIPRILRLNDRGTLRDLATPARIRRPKSRGRIVGG